MAHPDGVAVLRAAAVLCASPQFDDAGLPGGPGPRLPRAYDGCCGAAADHGGEGSLHRGGAQRFVERTGEDHVGAAVVAGDHQEEQRALEVHDRLGDLGSVLELEFAHGFR